MDDEEHNRTEERGGEDNLYTSAHPSGDVIVGFLEETDDDEVTCPASSLYKAPRLAGALLFWSAAVHRRFPLERKDMS